MRSWYRTDENALPEPEAVLRSKEEVGTDPGAPIREFSNAEKIMATALREAAVSAGLPAERLDEWTLSVTHKEWRAAVSKGVNPHGPGNIVVVHRTLVGLSENASSSGGAVHLHFTPERDVPFLNKFREEAWGAGPPPRAGRDPRMPRVMPCQYPWRGQALDLADGSDAAYVRRMSGFLFTVLATSAETAAKGHEKLSGEEREAAAHGLLAAQRARAFVGRVALRAAASRMLTPSAEPGHIKVVYGASGVGKTSLLAAAVVEAAAAAGSSVTIARFCGTTADSSDARSLLRSVCAQIAAAYDRELEELPASLDLLAGAWTRLMGECVSEARPLRIALDSLDQLSAGGDSSRVWGWLPRAVPPYVSLLVSALDAGPTLHQLRQGLAGVGDPDSFLAVGRLDLRESVPLLAALLEAHKPLWPPRGLGRRVTPEQMACLEACLVSNGGSSGAQRGASGSGVDADGGGGTALQLKLLAGEAARWRSWDVPPTDLPSTVRGLIQRLYERLEVEHGAGLVRLTLGLLAVSRLGLSTSALLDAISATDDVLGRKDVEGTVFQYGEPPVRRCPPSVFARLRNALGEFVVERAGPGEGTVLAYFHRQFQEVAALRYAGDAGTRAWLLGLLADLFSGDLAARFPDRGLSLYVRGEVEVKDLPRAGVVRRWRSVEACMELPHILLALGDPLVCGAPAARPDALKDLFCDLDFVAAAAHDRRVGELLANMATAETQLRLLGQGSTDAGPYAALVSMRRWARHAAPLLNGDRAYMAYVDALSSPRGCAADRSVRALIATGLDLSGCWAQLDEDRPATFPMYLAALEGHTQAVNCVAWSSDGVLLASGSDDKTVCLWSVTTGDPVATLKGHAMAVSCLAWSPDGRTIASGSFDGLIRLWSVATAESVARLQGHTHIIRSIVFSRDGSTLASASGDDTLRLWSVGALPPPRVPLESFKELRGHSVGATSDAISKLHTEILRETGGANCVCFAPGGLLVASGACDKIVRVWSAVSGDAVHAMSGHSGSVLSVAYSPDGCLVASGSEDATVRLWSAASGDPVMTLKGHTKRVTAVAFSPISPDGFTLASGSSDKTMRLWSLSTCETVAKLTGHSDMVLSVAFSPDGSMVASGSVDNTLRLWSSDTVGVMAATLGHTDVVNCVSLSPDGRTVASGSQDATLRLWTAAAGGAVATLRGHVSGVASTAWTRDSRTVASGARDGCILIWSVAERRAVARLEGHKDIVHKIVFSSDGTMLDSASKDRTVRRWATASGELLATTTGHSGVITSVQFAPREDASVVASGSDDTTIHLWSTSAGEALTALEGHADRVTSIAFSANGSWIASGSYDKTVRLWSASTGAPLGELTGHKDRVSSVAISPNGLLVASGSVDKTAQTWSIQTHEAVATFRSHTSRVTSVAWSPDSSKVASGSQDNTVRVWVAATGATVATLKGHTDGVTSVAWSTDGLTIASASRDTNVRLWSVAKNKWVAALCTGHKKGVSSVAFSPNGKFFASGSLDTTARLWSTKTRRAVALLTGHTKEVVSVSFSSDSGRLASGSLDETIRIWSTSTFKCLKVITTTLDAASILSSDVAPSPAALRTDPSFRPLPCTWSTDGRLVRVELPHPTGPAASGASAPVSVIHFPPGMHPLHASAALLGSEGARLLVVFQEGPVLRFRVHAAGS